MTLKALLWGFLFWIVISFQLSWVYYTTIRVVNIDIVFVLLFSLALTSRNKNAMVIIGFVVGILTDFLWNRLIGTNALTYAIIALYITVTAKNIDELHMLQLLKISTISTLIKATIPVSIQYFTFGYHPDTFEVTKDIFFNLLLTTGAGIWLIYKGRRCKR